MLLEHVLSRDRPLLRLLLRLLQLLLEPLHMLQLALPASLRSHRVRLSLLADSLVQNVGLGKLSLSLDAALSTFLKSVVVIQTV